MSYPKRWIFDCCPRLEPRCQVDLRGVHSPSTEIILHKASVAATHLVLQLAVLAGLDARGGLDLRVLQLDVGAANLTESAQLVEAVVGLVYFE